MWSYIMDKSDLIIKFHSVILSNIIQKFNSYHMSYKLYIFYHVFIEN